ncbi:malonate decarboxylase holo-ACP synthase [Utexia brackfieldae]|uniref:malonate decarboxylase holo-ACP synthase n=1 Tax=Utexia brackfieldae TaxID=3074108 RepID=UPI00370DDBDF
MMIVHPHDLIWIDNQTALQVDAVLPDWVAPHWHVGLPLVVRRDHLAVGLIPVGLRGINRSQRLAGYISADRIVKVATPESLIAQPRPDTTTSPVLQALSRLQHYPFGWSWGVTGSCGYQLATGIDVLTQQSDLDLLIRCPAPVSRTQFQPLAELVKTLPCRVDIQIETKQGGFALNEWLREDNVLLKTATGPRLTATPWQA